MVLRLLRKYWGCPPLIIALMLLFGVYLTQKNTELRLRYIPSLILVWLLICTLIIFALWLVLAIRKWLQRKEIYIETAHITFTTIVAIVLCIAGWIVTGFCLQPEQTTVKHNILMVACTQEVFEKNIYYYEYVNPFFYGKHLGSEYYGDFLNLSSYPLGWKFYDLNGKVIDSGSYKGEHEDYWYNDDSKETPSNDMNNILKQKAELVELNIEVMNNRENELVFSISVDDYVASYNGYYWRDNNARYLLPSSEWRSWTEETAIHSTHETRYYYFTADEKIWPLPTITVYAPTNDDYICPGSFMVNIACSILSSLFCIVNHTLV